MKASHKSRLNKPRYRVKLVKGHDITTWQLKCFGKEITKPILIARSKKQYAPRWILRLYNDINQFNPDVTFEEIKKYVGKFMRNGFSKKKLKPEEFTRITRRGMYK